MPKPPSREIIKMLKRRLAQLSDLADKHANEEHDYVSDDAIATRLLKNELEALVAKAKAIVDKP